MRRTISVHPFEARCLTSSRLIFPAPTMQTFESAKSCVGSLSWASSAAAEETDTAPEEIDVSARTLLPAVIACLKRPLRCLPKPAQFCPALCTCLTCARICPSPITSESRPPETRSKCCVASRSRSKNKCGLSSARGTPEDRAIHSSTSRTPRCHDSATT